MSITSIDFAVFTLVIFGLYYLVSSKVQNLVLTAASYLFIVSWDVQFAAIFLVLTLINYISAHYVANLGSGKKYALRFGILVNLLALVFFKYSDFFVPSAERALETLGLASGAGGINILLPVGLSFFVVQAISYLLDVNQGIAEPISDPIDFALYMVYFPRIISGPILRSRDFLPHLLQKRSIENIQFADSMMLIIQGLVRKVVIADLLFIAMPPDIFRTPERYSTPELAIWLVAFAFVLYNDFAGYTSIIRGISGLFGIPLPANFNVPYLSRDFSEFWKRWHITLSNWLRDYIYTPSTRALLRRDFAPKHPLTILFPPLATMFVSALWHDISWNMLVWGGMHGVYLVIERAHALTHPRVAFNAQPHWRRFSSILLVFVLTLLAWIPFRAELPAAVEYWSGLLSPTGWLRDLTNPDILQYKVLNRFTIDVIVLVGFSCVLDFLHYNFGELAVRRYPVPIQAIAINIALFALIVARIIQGSPPPFLYQGF